MERPKKTYYCQICDKEMPQFNERCHSCKRSGCTDCITYPGPTHVNHLVYSAIKMTARHKSQLGKNYFSQGPADASTTNGKANASVSSPNFNKT